MCHKSDGCCENQSNNPANDSHGGSHPNLTIISMHDITEKKTNRVRRDSSVRLEVKLVHKLCVLAEDVKVMLRDKPSVGGEVNGDEDANEEEAEESESGLLVSVHPGEEGKRGEDVVDHVVGEVPGHVDAVKTIVCETLDVEEVLPPGALTVGGLGELLEAWTSFSYVSGGRGRGMVGMLELVAKLGEIAPK